MPSRLIAFVLAALLAPLARAADLPADAHLDLFLLVGQSNMAGRGKVEAQDKAPDPHVWMLTKDNAWALAVDPLHFDKPKVTGVGPGRTFGIAVAAATHADVGLVPSAVGGTSIDQWKKGGKLYTDAITRAKAAMAHGTFKGIIWHQGEADLRKEPGEYFAKLTTLIAEFRADLQSPELPFVVGQLGPFHQKQADTTDAFNVHLLAFAPTVPHCGCATSEGLTTIGDDTHFDAASQREFGRRYATVYLKLIGQRSTSGSAVGG